MQDIDTAIMEKFNIEIRNITPYKDASIINTSGGKKLLLRKSPFLPERLIFIHGAKEHLYRNNFKNIDRYFCTGDGEPYMEYNGYYYTVSDFIDGRECSFDSRNDVIAASRLLAAFHKASRGYTTPEGSDPQDELGMLPAYFSKRLNEIRKLKKIAGKGRSRFDYLFLEYADYFYSSGENVINELEGSCYSRLVNDAKAKRGFCHHDFTHHNIIYSENEDYLVNFDYCCYELKIYDIANFLRRKMRKCNWDINEAKIIIKEYEAVESINEGEFFIMKLLLQFPQKFWRVANRYYNSRRSWSEKSYYTRLQEVIDEVRYHERFMDRYEQLM